MSPIGPQRHLPATHHFGRCRTEPDIKLPHTLQFMSTRPSKYFVLVPLFDLTFLNARAATDAGTSNRH
jgi:hypothetical protein